MDKVSDSEFILWENPKATPQEKARIRMNKFFSAMKNETYGPAPEAATGESILDLLGIYVKVDGKVVRVSFLDEWSLPEIRYALKVVRKLGYTPHWVD